jgi:hypothetical protein
MNVALERTIAVLSAFGASCRRAIHHGIVSGSGDQVPQCGDMPDVDRALAGERDLPLT